MQPANTDFMGSEYFDLASLKLLPGAPQDIADGYYLDLLMGGGCDRELTAEEVNELKNEFKRQKGTLLPHQSSIFYLESGTLFVKNRRRF